MGLHVLIMRTSEGTLMNFDFPDIELTLIMYVHVHYYLNLHHQTFDQVS